VARAHLRATHLGVGAARRAAAADVAAGCHRGGSPWRSGWTAPRRLHELVDGLAEQPALARFVPDLELVVDDLPSVDDDVLRGRPMPPFPKVALWLLRDGRSIEAFLAHLARWGDELDRLAREDPNPEDIALVVRYILRVAGEAPFDLLRERIAQAAPTFEEPMASAAEQLIQQGIQQGVQRGHVDTLRNTLVRLLRVRFGAIDENVQRQIDDASPATLERWIERVVTVANANDVFAPE
jgi:hypothetical protein